jgi:hypothetical protein
VIVFDNPGEIDPRLISTFGVNVKETENPIGFFGTGLKYAIAVLLRSGHRIAVQSGLTVYDLGIQVETIRGKDFNFVHMTTGGEAVRLGFTTEVGKTWPMWAAYRELYCNCRDESGEAYAARETPEPEAGRTRFIVIGDEFDAIHASRDQYFLEDEPDLIAGDLEVRRRQSPFYFYRGVRVAQLPRIAMFTYNDTQKLDLTEDRTAKNAWDIAYRIARAILTATDEPFLRQVLTASNETVEGALDFHGWSVAPSPAFLKVVGSLATDRAAKVNQTALRVWREATSKGVVPRAIALTSVQRQSLDRALDFCGKLGFPIRGSYPINVVESLGSGTLGMAFDETIWIAERAFQMGGAKQVASTLIEEYIHLKHGWSDCTREMQNFLFEKLVSVGEEMNGEPL